MLARSNSVNSIYYRDQNDKMRSISLSKFKTTYITWKIAKIVQIEDNSIISPGIEVEQITLSNFNTTLSISDTDLSVINITGSINSSIKEQGVNLTALLRESYYEMTSFHWENINLYKLLD